MKGQLEETRVTVERKITLTCSICGAKETRSNGDSNYAITEGYEHVTTPMVAMPNFEEWSLLYPGIMNYEEDEPEPQGMILCPRCTRAAKCTLEKLREGAEKSS